MKIFATSIPALSASTEDLMKDMEAEVAKGRQFYEEGLILQAYMDPEYKRTFMILEAESVEAAKTRFDEYPQVKAGLITFSFTPLIGMPAVSQVHAQRGEPLPDWWPQAI